MLLSFTGLLVCPFTCLQVRPACFCSQHVASTVQARCRFSITPFRVDLGSLPAEKGLVLLNHSAHRLAPLVVIVRGAQLFWGFLAVVCCALRPFPFAEAVYLRSDVEFPCRCAPFSVCRSGASLAWWLAFAPSCRTSRRFALHFRVFAPSARVASTASHPFVAGCGKSAPISTYPQFVFHRLVHPVEKLFTTPCVFLPRLSLFPPQGTPPPPARQPKAPLARVYIYIGVAKGEKDSAPSAAFRCGRGGSMRRGLIGGPAPWTKASWVGRAREKEWGSALSVGQRGGAIGRRQAKALGGAHGVCTRVATVGEEEGLPGRCACTIRAQMQVELPNEVCKL